MKRLPRKLTYSNVISTLCLVLLLGGGTAFAATELEKGSVGTKQLKKEAVTPAKLSKASKAALTGPAGPVGATGPQGAQGPQGPRGLQGEPGTPATSLWARLSPTGDLVAGSHVVSSSGTTPYNVTFDRDVTSCALVATPNGSGLQQMVSAVTTNGEKASIWLISRETGSFATDNVSVAAYC